MKLTSLWTQTSVYWRVFSPGDSRYLVGLADGTIIGSSFSYAEATDFAGEPDVQLELKRDGLGGAPILNADQNRLFLRGRHYVLRANGVVDDFREPTLAVTIPAANGTLPRSRLGKPDQLEASVDLRDWFALRLDYGLDQLEVYLPILEVRQLQLIEELITNSYFYK